MSNNDAELRIGANTKDAEDALSRLADTVKEAFGNIGKQFDITTAFSVALGQSIEKLAEEAFAKLKEALKESVEAFVHTAEEVEHMKLLIGGVPEDVSRMNIALQAAGITSATYEEAASRITRQLQTNSAAFDKYGVAFKDANGQMLPMPEIIQNVVDKLKEYQEGADRNVVGTELLGRGYASMTNLLKMNKAEQQEAARVADQFGQTMNEKDLVAAHAFMIETNLLSVAVKGFLVEIGRAIDPYLTDLASLLRDVLVPVFEAFKVVLGVVMVLVYEFSESIVIVWEGLRAVSDTMDYSIGLFKALGLAMTGDFAGATRQAEKAYTEYANNVSARAQAILDYTNKINARMNELANPSKSEEPEGKHAKPPGDSKKAADGGYIQQLEAELAQRKMAYELKNNFRKMDLADEAAYWESALQYVDRGSKEYSEIVKKAADLRLKSAEEEKKKQDDLWKEEIISAKKVADDRVVADEQSAKARLALGQITEQQYLQMELEFARRRYEADQAASNAEQEQLRQDGRDETVAIQKVQDAKEASWRKYQLDVAKINNDMAADQKKQWENMLSPITSAFANAAKGIALGTTTIQQAWRNMGASMLGETISILAKIVTNYAATELAKTSLLKQGSLLRLMLEKAGLVEATVAKTAAGTVDAATAKTTAAAVIPAEAAEAAGGAASAVASIPLGGPALAAAAYAETMAMVMGGLALASSAGGDWQIPTDRLNIVHAGETILPAAKSQKLDDALEGGGMRGGDIHLHVHTQSTSDFQSFLTRNSHSMAPALRRIARNAVRITNSNGFCT